MVSGATDDMVNNWGCQFVNTMGYRGSIDIHRMDLEIRSAVPNFSLRMITINGSDANAKAIALATQEELSLCLVAMGSYCAGDGMKIQGLSSSCPDNRHLLAFPKHPTICLKQCQDQTVAFPYFIRHKNFDEKKLTEMEDECLLALHRRIIIGCLQGSPFRALLMEYMLAGNGAYLSDNFLSKLGKLCSKFGITIVMDEIMTGGRVGPTMALTSSLPIEFSKVVQFITLGKVFDCGLVLERASGRPSAMSIIPRGVSTTLDAGIPFFSFIEIQDRLKRNLIPERRCQVLKAFDLKDSNDDEMVWGRGLLIFTSYARGWVTRNLGCRLLPMVEQYKIQKIKADVSKFDRTIVCKRIQQSTIDWLAHMYHIDYIQSTFTAAVADYLVSTKKEDLPNILHYHFVNEWLDEHLDQKEVLEAHKHNIGCKVKKLETGIKKALHTASKSSKHVLTKTKVSKKRTTGYLLNKRFI